MALKSKHVKLLALFMIVLVVSYYIWFFFWKDNHLIQLIGLDILCLAGGTTAVCSLLVSYRKSKGKNRMFWLLLALGCMSYLFGDAVWIYEELMLGINPNQVGGKDAFYILYIVLILAAFLYKIMDCSPPSQKLFILFDVFIIMFAAVTLEYYLIVGNILYKDTLSFFSKCIELIYSVGSLTLLFIAVTILSQPDIFSRIEKYYLAFGLLFYVFADSFFDYINLEFINIPLALLDPFYQVSMLLLAMAGAAQVQGLRYSKEVHLSKKMEETIRLLLPSLSAVGLTIFTIVEFKNARTLTIGLCFTLIFILARHLFTLIQNSNLLESLQELNTELEKRVDIRTKDLLMQKEALSDSKEQFKSLYQHHSYPIFTLDFKGNFTNVNKAGTRLLGYKAEQLLGYSYISFVYEEDMSKVQKAFESMKKGEPQNIELRAYYQNKDLCYLNITCVPIIIKQEITGFYVMVKDITEIKKKEEQIRYLAYHDTLTGLYNRRYFQDCLNKEIMRAKEKGEQFAVLFIDLDRFKIINDTLGHNIGDQLLIEIASILKRTVDSNAILARLGGDEFTILIPHVEKIDEVTHTAKSILHALNQPIAIGEHQLRITPSIGIAMYPEDGEDAASLLKHADVAMYSVKGRGKNDFALFEFQISDTLNRRHQLEKDLYQSLELKELVLVYQPQFDIRTNRIIGVEALIRWDHPQLGSISPNEFIPIAEESSSIIQIGNWVIREACKQMKQWIDMRYDDMKIAINLSVKQLEEDWFVPWITEILDETGLPPHHLELEITERIAMTRSEDVSAKLLQLKELGIQLSIDDFGTGYSSLAYLSLYPIDAIKLAREFLINIETNEEEKAIVSSLVALSKQLNIDIIAEGVETKEQVSFLQEHECYVMQGYYFSPPLEKEEMTKLLETSFLSINN